MMPISLSSVSRLIITALFLPIVGNAETTLETWKKTEDAAANASRVGHYQEAEQLLLKNQKLAETFPAQDARLPQTLFDLAQIYRAEGKYSEALAQYQRTREIYQKLYGAASVELARTLDGEGELYKTLGDFVQAEPLLAQSLELRRKLPSVDEAELAQSECDLGEADTVLGKFSDAEALLLDALAIRRKKNSESAEVGQSLLAIGVLYEKTNRATQAESSYREAASVFGKTVGGEHPDYANALEHLALACQSRKDFATAEPLLERVLEIRKTAFGPEHRDVATTMDNLAALKLAENKRDEAAALYQNALELWEKIVGPDSPELAPDLNNLGSIYVSRDMAKAEKLFLRAVALDEKAQGPDSPDLATDLNNLGLLYVIAGHYEAASKVLQRALDIRKKIYGDSDPLVKQTLDDYNSALHGLQTAKTR